MTTERAFLRSYAIPSLAVLMATGALATAAWCGVVDDERLDDEHFYENFLTAVATAPEDGYDVYWLGREFEAGRLTLEGPSVPDFAGRIADGGFTMSYLPPLAYEGVTTSVGVTLYSQRAWERLGDNWLASADLVERRPISVNGQDAELLTLAAGTRPVNVRAAVVYYPTTVVTISTGSLGPGPDGRDLNPLLDEEVFLSIVEQLRPYPE